MLHVVYCVSTCVPQQFWITVNIGLAYDSCNIKRKRTWLAWAFHTVPHLIWHQRIANHRFDFNLWKDNHGKLHILWSPPSAAVILTTKLTHIIWIATIACYVHPSSRKPIWTMMKDVYTLAVRFSQPNFDLHGHQAHSSTFKLMCVLSRHALRRWSRAGSAVAKWVTVPTAKAWHDQRRKRCRR